MSGEGKRRLGSFRVATTIFVCLRQTCFLILVPVTDRKFKQATSDFRRPVLFPYYPRNLCPSAALCDYGGMPDKITSKQEQEWDVLLARLDREVKVFTPSRHEIGHILYDMKVWLVKHGLDKGRKGKWEPVIKKYFKKDRKTAENYVRIYQEEAGIPRDKWVFAPLKKSQQNSKKNPVKNTGLPEEETIDTDPDAGADIVVADEDRKDHSEDTGGPGRMAVECIFVLTVAEKRTFMEAVKRLGSLRSTQLMYQAVVSAE